MMDSNNPEFNLTDKCQAIRLLSFLQQLRDVHAQRLHDEFMERKADFLLRWKHARESESREFKWTVNDQNEGTALLNVLGALRDEEAKVADLQGEIDAIDRFLKSKR